MGAATHPYTDADALADHWWWRPGWKVGTRFYAWHLTIEDQPQLQMLIQAYQQQLSHLASVDIVPTEWLHLTTQGLGHLADVPDDQRNLIIDAVRRKLAKLPPATVTFHRPVLHREAVVLPPTDPRPLVAVRTAIRAGIAEVWGLDQVPDQPDGFRPHISAGYMNAPGNPSPLRHAVDQVDVPPLTVTLHNASLILMHRDHRMYEWTTTATASIGDSLPN